MKKILCIILSLSFAFVFAPAVFAESNPISECPSIYITGFLNSDLCEDKNDISTEYEMPSTDEILELVKTDLIPALIVYAADRDSDKVAHEITEIANFVFKNFFNNPDGTAKGTSGAYMPYPEKSSIKKNSQLRFDYDWRGDPIVIATELNDFIDYVLQNSGSDKVVLQCYSLGSVMATSYISLYGNEKVAGILFDSPALDGISYIGDLMCGNPEIAGDALLRALKDLFGETEYNQLIESTLEMIELAGIQNSAGDFLDGIVEEIAPVIYEETLVPLCAYWPTIWAMTPDSHIDNAMDYIFTNYCTSNEHNILKGKIEAYNTLVRQNKKSTLLDFDKTGRIAVIARYGYASLPLTDSWNMLTDTVVDTCHASLGATTAEIDKHFDESYLKGKDISLISPDRTVDASTCLFPEKTWFIKNLKHDKTSITRPLYNGILFAEEEATVQNYKSLSRFMIFDPQTETLSEDLYEFKEETPNSPIEKLLNFLRNFFEFISNLFKSKE